MICKEAQLISGSWNLFSGLIQHLIKKWNRVVYTWWKSTTCSETMYCPEPFVSRRYVCCELPSRKHEKYCFNTSGVKTHFQIYSLQVGHACLIPSDYIKENIVTFFFSHVGIEFSLPLIKESGHEKRKASGTSLGHGEYVIKITFYIIWWLMDSV